MAKPALTIIVPSYNRATLLGNFLNSCLGSDYKDFEIIVNDDQRTNDATHSVIRDYAQQGLRITYLRENISMAQGRKKGAEYAKADVLLHLDTDMELSTGLLGECIDLIHEKDFDALVIPEESFGTTFWAKCKWFEKSCYNNVSQIESLRCVKKSIYESVGGHDLDMVFSEDKDLDLRIRAAGARVGRSKNILLHNEGNLELWATMRKKLNYTGTADLYAARHPSEYNWQKNPINRYILFCKNYKLGLAHPMIFGGVFMMKTCEYLASFIGIKLNARRQNHRQARTH